MTCLKCHSKRVNQDHNNGELYAYCEKCGYSLTQCQNGYAEMFDEKDHELVRCPCGEKYLIGTCCNNGEYHRGVSELIDYLKERKRNAKNLYHMDNVSVSPSVVLSILGKMLDDAEKKFKVKPTK